MRNQFKYFCNAVVHEDLFFAIYDYLRFHPQVAHEYYHIVNIDDLDKLSVEDWKGVAEDTIHWLEHDQLPQVYKLGENDDSPGKDTWELFIIKLWHILVVKRPGVRQFVQWKLEKL